MTATSPALRADGITKSFGGVKALDGMSLEVPHGRITGLIGPNGAGKSSLFDVLSGVQRADAGRVEFDGRDVTGAAPDRLAGLGMARTFQFSRELARATVLENLMVSPSGQSGERLLPNFLQPAAVRRQDREVFHRARDVLARVGLAELADSYAGELSGGQKKLLALGRALMRDARLILLDEPGAGVNRTLMRRLVAIIEEMNGRDGITFLIVEHDMDLVARTCDRVVVMVAGRPLVTGTFEEIRRDPRVLEAYLGGIAA